tara:strand:+ start:1287 stop:1589 length:303 start_codon:yes stop_codon:yes gene_type:complete
MKQKIYYDRNHGGCIRMVTKIDKHTSIIKGAYGNDEKSKGYWFAEITHLENDKVIDNKKYNMLVDFKHKKDLKHKQKLYANMIGRKIYWEDGNCWLQMYA